MAQTQGATAYGTLIKYGDGASPEVFTTVDECYQIGPLTGSKDTVDMTHHESPGGWAEFLLSGVTEGQEIAVEANEVYNNVSQDEVRSRHTAGSLDNWRLVFNSGATETFPALVIMTETDASDIRGKVIFRFTLKIAGQSTRA